MIGSSKRVLSGTKDENKIKSIKAGVALLEDFLEKFDQENRSKLNLAYLPSAIVAAFGKPKHSLNAEFVSVYDGTAKGNYKHLRTLFPKDDDSTSWDIIRNRKLTDIKAKIGDKKLFNDDGSPTDEHLKLIHWAYSPQTDKVKRYADKLKAKKRKSHTSSDDEGTPSKKSKSK